MKAQDLHEIILTATILFLMNYDMFSYELHQTVVEPDRLEA